VGSEIEALEALLNESSSWSYHGTSIRVALQHAIEAMTRLEHDAASVGCITKSAVDAVSGDLQGCHILTLEQLRGMNDERVWVQFVSIGMYGIVAYHADPDGDDGDNVYITDNLGGRNTFEEILNQGGTIYSGQRIT